MWYIWRYTDFFFLLINHAWIVVWWLLLPLCWTSNKTDPNLCIVNAKCQVAIRATTLMRLRIWIWLEIFFFTSVKRSLSPNSTLHAPVAWPAPCIRTCTCSNWPVAVSSHAQPRPPRAPKTSCFMFHGEFTQRHANLAPRDTWLSRPF